MRPAEIKVRHWSLLDDPEKFKIPIYYCWVFTAPDFPDFDFGGWMKQHCPTADCTFRFNSGNPMYSVSITDKKEALIFQLRWNTNAN